MALARSPVHEILLATDFSSTSDAAARVALDYAKQFGARVHLFHVLGGEERAVTSLLAKLVEDFTPIPTVVRAVKSGNPAAEIVSYASQHAIDLIVVGTHGRTGYSRALLGSVAERVARAAPCPVLTVPGREQHAAAPEVTKPAAAARRCLVCAKPSDDLVCEPCRAHIRGEALERKQREERGGRS